MDALLGSSLGVFLGMTIVLFGGAAFMTGQAVAQTWRPARQLLPYAVLLGLGDSFLKFALFEAELLSPSGYAIDVLLLLGIAWIAYRATLARLMVVQYPWLYERAGLFGWREKV